MNMDMKNEFREKITYLLNYIKYVILRMKKEVTLEDVTLKVWYENGYMRMAIKDCFCNVIKLCKLEEYDYDKMVVNSFLRYNEVPPHLYSSVKTAIFRLVQLGFNYNLKLLIDSQFYIKVESVADDNDCDSTILLFKTYDSAFKNIMGTSVISIHKNNTIEEINEIVNKTVEDKMKIFNHIGFNENNK